MRNKIRLGILFILSTCISTSTFAGVPKDITTEYQSICIDKNKYIIKNDNTLWSLEENPKQILTNVVSICNDNKDFFALKENGDLMAWGSNSKNIFGLNPDNISHNIETPVKIMDNVISVDILGHFTALFLKNDGSLWISGLDFNYTVGEIGFISSSFEIGKPIKIMDDVIYQSNGYAIKSDHTLWTWETNLDKKSGSWRTPNDTWISCKEEPKKIMDNVIWTNGNFAIKEDDTLWAWGKNKFGELGVGSPGDMIITPTKVMDDVKFVNSRDVSYNTFILKNDGTLWSCGLNSYSQLGYTEGNAKAEGDPDLVTVQTIPKQFMSDIKSTFGNYAIKNDDTLWSWSSGEPISVLENVAYASGIYILKNDNILLKLNSKENTLEQVAEDVKIIQK